MSSSAVSTKEDLQLFIATYRYLSVPALLLYEYIITFDREYQLVWKRPFSAATLLFLVARYSMLLNFILNLPTIYPISITSCSALVWLVVAFELLFIFLVSTFSGLRAYNFSVHKWQITSLIFILSLVSCGPTPFLHVRQVAVVAPPRINCTTVPWVSPELNNILKYIGHAATIAADILILTVTIQQTYWKMLNLRAMDASQCGIEHSSRPSFVRSIQFAAFIEPLGAPLDHELSLSTIDRSSSDDHGAD